MPTVQDLEGRLKRIEAVLTKIAAGDFSETVPITGRGEDLLTNLEVGINFIAQDLSDMFERNRVQAAALAEQRRALDERAALLDANRETIAALSTPVIQVWRDVLCLPLVGTLDDDRAAEMTERVLTAVARSHARGMILDITGIEEIDTTSAGSLLATARAVRLLGCEAVITGVSARVAQTLVELDANFGTLRTSRSLFEGLRYFVDRA